MKKNLAILVLLFISINLLNAQLVIKKVTTPPVIDGSISSGDTWNNLGDYNNVLLPAENTTTNFTAKFKICYDDNNIYALIIVHDTTPYTAASSPWQNDEVEFFFGLDTISIQGGTFTTGDYQLRKQRDITINNNGFDGEFDDGTWTSTAINGSSKSDFLNDPNFQIAETDDGINYIEEWKIPISLLTKGLQFTNGINPSSGGTGWDGIHFRFDAQVGNNYNGTNSARLFYYNNSNLDYNYASYWDDAIFNTPLNTNSGLTPALTLQKTTKTVIPDGTIDVSNEPWTNTWIPISDNKTSNSTSEMTAGFQMAYNDQYLWLAVKQTGNSEIDTSYQFISWERDCNEVFIGVDTNSYKNKGVYEEGDLQFRMIRGVSSFPSPFIDALNDNTGGSNMPTANYPFSDYSQFAQNNSNFKIGQVEAGDGSFVQEWQIPWKGLAGTLKDSGTFNPQYFKFEIQAADNTGLGRTQQIFWHNNSDIEYFDSRTFSLVYLASPVNLINPATKQITVSSINIEKNKNFNISISTDSIIKLDNIISYQVNIGYDQTKMQYVGYSINGTFVSNGSVDINSSIADTLKISYMNSSPIIGSGNILTLQFKSLIAGKSSVNISNFYYNETPINNITNGIVSITNPLPIKVKSVTLSNSNPRYGDTVLVSALFTEPVLSSSIPKIKLNGATNTDSIPMSILSDSVYTHTFVFFSNKGGIDTINIADAQNQYGDIMKDTTFGSFNLTPIRFGDVDDNGQVMAYDAALTLQYSVGLNPQTYSLPWMPWRVETANVDGTGKITANDASFILKYSVGLISSFPNISAKNATDNNSDVIIALENDSLVFSASGQLFGLNVDVKNNYQSLGTPVILNQNIISASNISPTNYAIGLATAYAPNENSIFMKIPVIQPMNETLTFDLNINSVAETKDLSIATSVNVNETTVLSIYPNPVIDKLYIKLSTGTNNTVAVIYDLQGNIVAHQKFSSADNTINTAFLQPGCYMLRLTGNNANYSRMFVKK